MGISNDPEDMNTSAMSSKPELFMGGRGLDIIFRAKVLEVRSIQA